MARRQRVLKDDAGDVFHTYSTYGRGVEVMMGTYRLLDLTPKGRDERDTFYKMEWVRHHDRYEEELPAQAAADASCCEARAKVAGMGKAHTREVQCGARERRCRSRRSRLAVPGGGADLRRHGVADQCSSSGQPDIVCSTMHDASPLGGMVPMYALMAPSIRPLG